MRMFSSGSSLLGGPSLLDSGYYAKVGGSPVGFCPEEHWDKTLMLTITGREAQGTEENGSEQMVLDMQRAPGNFILTREEEERERVRYQK